MRRDWWKIRHVLLAVRDGEDLGTHPPKEIGEHLRLCSEADFLIGLQIYGPSLTHDFEVLSPGRLTWEGQDAASLLEDGTRLNMIGAELDDLPWEVLRGKLIRMRWPEPETKAVPSDGMFHVTEHYHVQQTKLCMLCRGSGLEPLFGSHHCPVCRGARVIKE